MTTEMTTVGATTGGCHCLDPRLHRHEALHDVACDAERRAQAARDAMQRVPEGSEAHTEARMRWDALCRIAGDLRSAPGYRLQGEGRR